MSWIKKIAGFILSILFIISLYLTISSYTIGDLIQKDNIKSFIQTQTTGELASETCEEYCSEEFDYQTCEEYCNYLDVELRQACKNECSRNISETSEIKQACIQTCLSKMSNESQEYVYKTIDEVYSKKIIDDINLDDVTLILRNSILFLVLSLIFALPIFFVSDKPILKLGNNIVVVSISLLSMAVIPVFMITPDIPIINLVIDYVLEGLYQQLYIGIALLVIGIVLIIIEKVRERRKKKGK